MSISTEEGRHSRGDLIEKEQQEQESDMPSSDPRFQHLLCGCFNRPRLHEPIAIGRHKRPVVPSSRKYIHSEFDVMDHAACKKSVTGMMTEKLFLLYLPSHVSSYVSAPRMPRAYMHICPV